MAAATVEFVRNGIHMDGSKTRSYGTKPLSLLAEWAGVEGPYLRG